MSDRAEIKALLDRAVDRHRAADFQAARALYEQVLTLDPDEANSLTNIGTLCCQSGDIAAGIDFLERSLKAKPGQPHALSNLASALIMSGRFEEARPLAEEAVSQQPDNPEVWKSLGNIRCELGDPAGGIEAYRRAVELEPRFAEAWYRLGVALFSRRRLDEALSALDHAIALAPAFPAARTHRAHALRERLRFDEALAEYDAALAITHDVPGRRDILSNKAIALYELRRTDEALAAFAEAWAVDPAFAEAPCNMAVIEIATGRYAEGWKRYEWRWKGRAFKDKPNPYGQPPWLGGSDIRDKTLLVVSEQGAGDTIQMLRYADVLAGKGATVLFAVQDSLAALAATAPGVARVLVEGQALPPWDAFVPAMSLPHAVGTQPDTVPATVPYLAASPAAEAKWAAWLGPRVRPRIGLAWSGNPGHANDHNRSLNPAQLGPLVELDAEFVSLHAAYRDGDREWMAGQGVRDVSAGLLDFMDTAGLIAQLDLVISVDTAVAHLAGALAKPLWLLLPYTADYRWHLDGRDTPWYPTATLVRQGPDRDWAGVVERLTAMAADWLRKAG